MGGISGYVAAEPAAGATSAPGERMPAGGALGARDGVARGGLGARGGLKVDELQGRAAFDALREEWEALLASGPVDQPFQKHAFIAAWLDAFAPRGELRVLVARDAAGRAVGMAPLLEERAAGTVTLRAPANDHSSRVEWVLGAEPRGACEALWGHLRDRLRWDVLLLRDVPRHGPTSTAVEELARRDGHPVGRWESLVTPYLPLGAEPREEQVSRKFLGNLRRRMRRLEEQGSVSVWRVDGGDGVTPFLEAFFRLEAAGWKGQRGTAIAAHPATLTFYRGLARAAAAGGWLALRALELDGRPVAMHFGLRHRGVHSLPKPAYEEGLGACSPGQLLFREVLAECEARRLAELDFLGPDMPWKRDWAPALRPHDFLHVYRPGLPGAARHALKFQLKPLAKEVLSWWRR